MGEIGGHHRGDLLAKLLGRRLPVRGEVESRRPNRRGVLDAHAEDARHAIRAQLAVTVSDEVPHRSLRHQAEGMYQPFAARVQRAFVMEPRLAIPPERIEQRRKDAGDL